MKACMALNCVSLGSPVLNVGTSFLRDRPSDPMSMSVIVTLPEVGEAITSLPRVAPDLPFLPH